MPPVRGVSHPFISQSSLLAYLQFPYSSSIKPSPSKLMAYQQFPCFPHFPSPINRTALSPHFPYAIKPSLSKKETKSTIICSSSSFPISPANPEYEYDHGNKICGGLVGAYGGRFCYKTSTMMMHGIKHRGDRIDNPGFAVANADGTVEPAFLSGTYWNVIACVGFIGDMHEGGQPWLGSSGGIAVATTGCIHNYEYLKMKLLRKGVFLESESEGELIVRMIDSLEGPLVQKVIRVCEELQGAYSMLVMGDQKLIAVCDPFGFRPLVMGATTTMTLFASESEPFHWVDGAKYDRDILPGEMVVVDEAGLKSFSLVSPPVQRRGCIFEHLYFSCESSIFFGRYVYDSRYDLGVQLAIQSPVKCDLVIPMYGSSIIAAHSYADELGVEFDYDGFYVRDFVRPWNQSTAEVRKSTKMREKDFYIKTRLFEKLAGKRVVIVDDSLIRASSFDLPVVLLKQAGATEVHLRIACPSLYGKCLYGAEVPANLFWSKMRATDIAEIHKYDSVERISLENAKKAIGEGPGYCDGCLSGEYPLIPS